MPFPTLTIEQERKLALVNNRIMRREMERNPSRKFFRKAMKPTAIMDLRNPMILRVTREFGK